MEKRRLIILGACAAIVVAALVFRASGGREDRPAGEETEAEASLLYGIDITGMEISEGVIESGQTLSGLFETYGVGASMVDRTVRASDGVFDLRTIKAGNSYTAFTAVDSASRRLAYFVYEQNRTDYIVISYPGGDSVAVRREHKDVTTRRHKGSAVISSSLWNSMIDAGMTPALFKNLADIYAWSIDFFGLQEGDKFTVIYDELFVDTASVGAGQIWGAIFTHRGKDYYAIPFRQGDKITYWDENANSLRKNMLKAPLNFSRISSRFSNSRMHPVLRIRRPHHGVDYAAPAGTPVHAVADGTVTFRGWDRGGGGNMLKIRHSQNLTTGYLHLRGYAAGIVQGKRVSQGDLIGYVGSTGVSTGPHLDYRVWRGTTPIDPLSITSEPAEPISAANMADFGIIKERVMAELTGDVPDELKVTQLDSMAIYRSGVQLSAPNPIEAAIRARAH